MTGSAGTTILVLDTPGLNHFALAERLDVFQDLMAGNECRTTQVVIDELRQGADGHPTVSAALDLEWLTIDRLDTLSDLGCFAKWIRRVGKGSRDLGEASVLTVAELRVGVAITDDREAVRVGRRHHLEVHGTLWLLARACREGKLTETATGNLIEALRTTGMRLPCTGSEFPRWARQQGLL